jgi:hypothetical protein
MAPPEVTTNSATLELQSLQLDVQTLRREREEDKKQFSEFSKTVQANFLSIQENFANLQTNFTKFFEGAADDVLETPEPDQGQRLYCQFRSYWAMIIL